jgi:gamma-glutamyltranspeptidase/glutathione hydrolase
MLPLPSSRPAPAALTRREAIRFTARLTAAGFAFPSVLRAAPAPAYPHGVVRGEPTADQIGAAVLASGGNAVDAVVAAALAAAVCAPAMTGIGGYGAAIMIASADGKNVVAIDANSAAPAAARADMFPLDEKGHVRGRVNDVGWLAAGVPGILAGLQLALDRHGTRSFRDSVQPAIALARDGFSLTASVATTMRNLTPTFRTHAGGRALFLKNGATPGAGEIFRNPDLAALLTTLAQRNSVDSFYRGDIAQRIADDFAKNAGLVTAADLAAYRAHEVAPLRFAWNGSDVCTAPLTAGGFTMLQCLTTLRALDWHRQPAGLPRTHAYLEALRLAWRDRLALLGDPSAAPIPQEKLLSDAYARDCADRIRHAVKTGTILPQSATPRPHGGTIHLSAVDRHGNMAAITLTHGNGFGAGVTVDGLGLTLGHGLSRFETKPGHPNSPGPGKRPLHNMCPSIVLRDGRPVLALGGRGGRKIPNAVLETLTQFVALDRPLEAAVAAPRPHTEGTSAIELEAAWPAAELAALPSLGYKVKSAVSATVSAVCFDPRSGESRAALR